MNDKEKGKLLPCPFCGSENLHAGYTEIRETYTTLANMTSVEFVPSCSGKISCMKCGIGFSKRGITAKTLVNKWNTRKVAGHMAQDDLQ
ncbi:MAG: Lar family restriction alleviation protein [Defluviitaleaceae bacterium]|nr:Lar family restriction alleviation protein [Defluviitaleaceae bacterium]